MKKILLLLANGFEAVEASVFTDVLGWNKWEGDGTTESACMNSCNAHGILKSLLKNCSMKLY